MSSAICVICHESIFVELDPESEEEGNGKGASVLQTVLDDVEPSCGCHYHWECFLESDTMQECSNCSKDISSTSADKARKVLCTVRNDGGTQTNFDILPTAVEEAYLKCYPEERRGFAFLELCKEGDVDAIVHLLEDEDVEAEGDHIDILRYQESVHGTGMSGLHLAVANDRIDVVWLLVFLGSKLAARAFPDIVLKEIHEHGFAMKDRRGEPDVRSLTNSEGQRALDLARIQDSPQWSQLITKEMLEI